MMKYLIMEDFAGKPAPFVFPERVDHADMRDQLPYGRIISCGSLLLEADGLHCFGGNSDLDMQARPLEDAEIILDALRGLEGE